MPIFTPHKIFKISPLYIYFKQKLKGGASLKNLMGAPVRRNRPVPPDRSLPNIVFLCASPRRGEARRRTKGGMHFQCYGFMGLQAKGPASQIIIWAFLWLLSLWDDRTLPTEGRYILPLFLPPHPLYYFFHPFPPYPLSKVAYKSYSPFFFM